MNNITVDDKQVLGLFADLTSKEQKNVYRQALRKGSAILINQTKSNLRSIIKGSITKRSSKTGKSLASGIKASIDRDATQSTVHIMGDFRLKFFEKGTKIRKTRKGYNRGEIKGRYFFRDAQYQTESQIFTEMDNIILESIVRVRLKHK
ncbi:hypothetical protein [Proteiniphilum acetatigenes]|uniref:hypothetical protein n=1 Tax=Proteiniphilum acetatigenes TaxID=294710 RepID=UPI00036FF9A7|nr:hypothetical protein [Proteiniphilum acetatigenes]